MTITEAIQTISQKLIHFSDTAKLDAEILVGKCCVKTRTQLYTHPNITLNTAQQNSLEKDLRRRINGEPIAYILGHKEFWSLKFKVTHDTLIPRPETEHLVEWTLKQLPAEKKIRIADLGTGCGAIGIALAHERPQWTIDATDISQNTLDIAKQNANNHGLKNICFYSGNWCDALPHQHYDAIISNPPYIPCNDRHLEQLNFEPQSALIAGEDGLDAIKIITSQAKNYLKSGGNLILEHGFDQKDKILKQLKQSGYLAPQVHYDYNQRPRFSTSILGKCKFIIP